jgi:hypothetical protein
MKRLSTVESSNSLPSAKSRLSSWRPSVTVCYTSVVSPATQGAEGSSCRTCPTPRGSLRVCVERQRLPPASSHHDDPVCARSRRIGEFKNNIFEGCKSTTRLQDRCGNLGLASSDCPAAHSHAPRYWQLPPQSPTTTSSSALVCLYQPDLLTFAYLPVPLMTFQVAL